jgi:dsRNA-specific ribonuclease
MNIQDFAVKYQRRFGTNIEFGMAKKTGPDHRPVVTVEVFTNFGTFEGSGSNKKVARANAVGAAAASPDYPF